MPRSRSAATGSATPSGATSPSTRCRRRATARSTTMSAGSPTSRRGACASSATPRTRIAEDYLRILRFFRFHAAYGEGAPDPAGSPPASPARAGLEQLSRERVRMELIKLLLAAHAVPALAVMAEAGLLEHGARRRAAARELRQHDQARSRARARARCRAPARRARGPRSSRMPNGCASGCGSPMPNTSGSPSMADALVAHFAGAGRAGRARAALSARAGALHRPRAARLGALAAKARGSRAGARSRPCPTRWTAPAFPLKAADFIARGVAKGPRLGAACARPRRPGSRPGFRTRGGHRGDRRCDACRTPLTIQGNVTGWHRLPCPHASAVWCWCDLLAALFRTTLRA